MGAEIRQRGYLRDLLAATVAWQTWTGLSDLQARKDRIFWPSLPGTNDLPGIVIGIGSSQRVLRFPGGAEHSGCRANGELVVLVFDAVNTSNTERQEDDRFGGLFTDLLDELVELPAVNAWEGGIRIRQVQFPEVPWRRTDLNTEDDLDQGQDNEDLYRGAVWVGKAFVSWGVFD